MSTRALDWVEEHYDSLTLAQRWVLYRLADLADEHDDVVRQTVEAIANHAHCSTGQARAHITALAERGLILREQHRGAPNSLYFVGLPDTGWAER